MYLTLGDGGAAAAARAQGGPAAPPKAAPPTAEPQPSPAPPPPTTSVEPPAVEPTPPAETPAQPPVEAAAEPADATLEAVAEMAASGPSLTADALREGGPAIGADAGPLASGDAGPGCRLEAAVGQALQADERTRSALQRLPRSARSVANAIMLWDGAWVPDGPATAGAFAALRESISAELTAAEPSCRAEVLAGPVFIPVETGGETVVLTVGSGVWRWGQLTEDHAR